MSQVVCLKENSQLIRIANMISGSTLADSKAIHKVLAFLLSFVVHGFTLLPK